MSNDDTGSRAGRRHPRRHAHRLGCGRFWPPPTDRPLVRHLKAIAAIAGAQRAEMPDMSGPLRLLERIGQGAFGDVYRAWDPRLDREVALKLLPVDALAVEPACDIDHRRRPAVRPHPAPQCRHYLWRRADRRSCRPVDGICRRPHPPSARVGGWPAVLAPEVAAIGQALCGAVAAVHAAGLLHRDIKAQNVMMARRAGWR